MNNLKSIQEHVVSVTTCNRRPILSNFFAGIGIYYALHYEDSVSQAVLSLFAPSIYIGYQSFKNYDKLKDELGKIKLNIF